MVSKNTQWLSEQLGHDFSDQSLLQVSLTHKSYANERPDRGTENNERLEFLGDAILDLVISDLLMRKYPHQPEGQLSKLRAGLVSEPSLATVARELKLGPFLMLGKGEESTGGRDKDSILSDALEAVVAAVYLDGHEGPGFAQAYRVVERLFESRIAQLAAGAQQRDFKTDLQELAQKHYKEKVSYRITSAVGPDHEKRFESSVTLRGRELARGAGRSKKHAEQAAARTALHQLQAHIGEAAP